MKKGFYVWFVIIMVTLLFLADHVQYRKELSEAKSEAYAEGYNSGYADAESELSFEIEDSYFEGYADGFTDGRKDGLDTARTALEDPDGILASFILSGDYEDGD